MTPRSGAILAMSVAMTAAACQRPPVSVRDDGRPMGGEGGAGSAGGTGGFVRQPCASIEWPWGSRLLSDVLILLDASGSMNNDVDDTVCPNAGCGALSKWALLTPGLVSVVAENEASANWGLKMFADADLTCGVTNNVAVAVGKMNAAAIAAAIAARTSANGGLLNGSRTPTRAAVSAAATYLAGLTDGGAKQILLLTDGTPNCSATSADAAADDSVATVQAIADARARGVSTIVVGIATAGGPADQALSAMAVAGGHARTGAAPAYYPLSNLADLKSVLAPLITTPADCVVSVPPPPVAGDPPRNISLRANGAPIPFDADHRAGWDWTDMTWSSVRIYGPVCDELLAGRIASVTIELYCGDPT
jgi:hypothetical protein